MIFDDEEVADINDLARHSVDDGGVMFRVEGFAAIVGMQTRRLRQHEVEDVGGAEIIHARADHADRFAAI